MAAVKEEYLEGFFEIVDFFHLDADDWTVIKAHNSILDALINKLCDETYKLLTSREKTKAALLSRRDPDPKAEVKKLVPMRRSMLSEYFTKLLNWGTTDRALAEEIERMAVIHKLYVTVGIEYMCGLLAVLEGVAIEMILQLPEAQVSTDQKPRLLKAINKLMWLQNHVFVMVYSRDSEPQLPCPSH
eukprot:Protomagalhaensia_wolfi_Nauph_80__1929@NODE_220_length_3146_cov_646_188606_g165_i0_p4_GENE_NODE_220_length_3146_cov_646_188606_g165_i0NODE_220_length_3146_cov_646_188606_g165_i0_p4_ORF_typecomplete_len187_score25_13Protoglobin/PF11563_8/3_6e19TPR_22/PF18833_1/0_011NUP214/PF16755_5/0_098_NODE_220_length_3146_cov_646_188606_g165_i05661126